MKKTGAIILVVGALITTLTAFNFTFTTKENVVDAGNFQINHDLHMMLLILHHNHDHFDGHLSLLS